MDTTSPDTMAPAPKKSGHGALTAIIILIIALIAVLVFWPKHMTSQTAPGAVGSQQNVRGSQAQADDLNSIEADVKSTNVDGISSGL